MHAHIYAVCTYVHSVTSILLICILYVRVNRMYEQVKTVLEPVQWH